MISESYYWQDKRTCTVFIEVKLPDFDYAIVPNFERINQFQATWTAYPLSKSHTLVRYSGWLDAGGYIPQVIANKVAVNSLFKTFVKLKKEIIKPQYNSSQLANFPDCETKHFYHNETEK